MKENIIAQAAEALILKQGNEIIKRRIKKSYRIPEIDEKLRKLRTRQEGKLLEKANKLISTPKIINVDEKNKEITMEFIEGKKLSENLDNLNNKLEIAEQIGEETAKIHDSDIIHGDLTTSNMILVENNKNDNVEKSKETSRTKMKNVERDNNKSRKITENRNTLTTNLGVGGQGEVVGDNFQIYFIDFGLGFISKKIEDKAVDIHLFKQALEAKHFNFHEKLFEAFLKGYKTSKNADKTLEQLKKVEARGRYKH